MASQWYCRIGKTELGPMPGRELKRLAREGRLTADSPVRRGHDTGWVAAKQIKGLLDGTSSNSTIISTAVVPEPAAAPAKRRTPKSVEAKAAPPRKAKPAAAKVTASVAVSDSVSFASSDTEAVAVAATPIPVAAQPVAATAAAPADYATIEPKKKKSSLGLILSIVALILVMLGGTAVFGVWYAVSKTRQAVDDFNNEVAAQVASLEEEVSDGMPHESGTNAEGDQAVSDQDAVEVDDSSQRSDSTDPNDPRTAIVRRIKKWKPAIRTDKTVKVQTSKMTFEVVAAWLGDDLGHDVSDQGNGAKLGAQPTPRYLMAQMKIGNRMQQPLKYEGWNGINDSTLRGKAILLDDQGRFGDMVPFADAPSQDRLRPTQIEPDGFAVDTLVFELPSTDFDLLRLVVPVRGVGSGYYGFELSKAMIVGSGVAAEEANPDNPGGPIHVPGLGTGPTTEPGDGEKPPRNEHPTRGTQPDTGGPITIPGLGDGSALPPGEGDPTEEAQPIFGRDPDGPGEAIAIPGLP